MIMTIEDAKKVVAGCVNAGTVTSNGYNGNLADVQRYRGRKGIGYTVTTRKKTTYYIYPAGIIADKVYQGAYSLAEAARKTKSQLLTSFDGVAVIPNWRLTLDTISGDVTVDKDETLKDTIMAGNKLQMWFRGPIDEIKAKRKLRRAMKTWKSKQ